MTKGKWTNEQTTKRTSTWVHPRFFVGVRVAHLFIVLCCPIMWFTFWVPCCNVRYNCMSYLRHLCLFEYSGVQHISCCVFVLFFFVLCTLCLCCQFLWIVHLWLPLRYTLIYLQNTTQKNNDRATRTPLKIGGELRWPGRVSSSCSTSDTRRVISKERTGKCLRQLEHIRGHL